MKKLFLFLSILITTSLSAQKVPLVRDTKLSSIEQETVTKNHAPAQTFFEMRNMAQYNDSVIFRFNYNGTVGDFRYDPLDTTTPDDSAMCFVGSGGKRYKRFVNQVVDARWFGADPSGYNVNDWQCLQNAINWIIKYRTDGVLFIPGGQYDLFERGLEIRKDLNDDGHSEFVSLEIHGEKPAFTDGNADGSETILVVHNITDFGIGVQKGKGVTIRNIAFRGYNTEGYNVNPLNCGLAATSFLTPGVRNNHQSPYSAVIIDYLCSAALDTSNRYHERTDEYTEVSSGGSSDVRVEDCYINGFAVGIMNSPTGIMQNGETHLFKNLWIYDCISAIANGDSQNRTVACDNIKVWGGTEVMFDCRRYGNGTGSAFIVNNVNVAGAVRYLTVPCNFGIGTINVFTNVHLESIHAIGGNIIDSTIDGSQIVIKGGQMAWNGSEGGVTYRAPVLGWCGTLKLEDVYSGYYAGSDGTYQLVACNLLVTDNVRGGEWVNFGGTNETKVSERNSSDRGIFSTYYLSEYNSSPGNNLQLYNGVTIVHDYEYYGAPAKSTYNGKSLNVYTTANSVTCIGRNSVERVDTFTCNAADYYMICSDATVYLTGLYGFAGRAYTIGSNRFVIAGAHRDIEDGHTYANMTLYQKAMTHGNPAFMIGDIVSGSNIIHNIESEFNASIGLRAGFYFNHPAFPRGTWVTYANADSVVLSAVATRTETGAFVGHEYAWHTTGYGGGYQATGAGGFYTSLVWKEGDEIANTYSQHNTSVDTSIYKWICVKSGKINSARLPIFKTVKN